MGDDGARTGPGATCWLAVLDAPDPAATVVAAVTERGRAAGWLCGWAGRPGRSAVAVWRRPHRAAVRCDPELLGPGGPWELALTLPARRDRPLHDDPAVVAATRRALLLAGQLPILTAFVADEVHWAGGLAGVPVATADRWPGWTALDPWAALGTSRVLRVDSGVLRARPQPVGPGTQRHGGAPWPSGAFDPSGG